MYFFFVFLFGVGLIENVILLVAKIRATEAVAAPRAVFDKPGVIAGLGIEGEMGALAFLAIDVACGKLAGVDGKVVDAVAARFDFDPIEAVFVVVGVEKEIAVFQVAHKIRIVAVHERFIKVIKSRDRGALPQFMELRKKRFREVILGAIVKRVPAVRVPALRAIHVVGAFGTVHGNNFFPAQAARTLVK